MSYFFIFFLVLSSNGSCRYMYIINTARIQYMTHAAFDILGTSKHRHKTQYTSCSRISRVIFQVLLDDKIMRSNHVKFSTYLS